MELRAAFLAGILFFVASSVYGAEKFRSTDQQDRPIALTLSNEPCKESVSKWFFKILPQFRDGMKAATLHYGGRDWDSCWIEVHGHIFSIDEEGIPLNGGRGIPRSMFKDNMI